MTSPLWFWCFFVWAVDCWPPGSALLLQPGMPNVCKEEKMTVVGLSRPCAQAFIETIKFWKQGCTGPRWCVAYERRTRYYTVYRQVYVTEHQAVFSCCPGWSRWNDEPGCLTPVSSLGTHFSGRLCSDEADLRCLCSQGFHGPHCQYDSNCHRKQAMVGGMGMRVNVIPVHNVTMLDGTDHSCLNTQCHKGWTWGSLCENITFNM